jgi:hypothetical protein
MGGTMRWAELRMCRFWAGGISSFSFSRAREYRVPANTACYAGYKATILWKTIGSFRVKPTILVKTCDTLY